VFRHIRSAVDRLVSNLGLGIIVGGSPATIYFWPSVGWAFDGSDALQGARK